MSHSNENNQPTSDRLESLAVGTRHELTYQVAAFDSPRTLRLEDQDEFPDVLATAKMVGLMELAAARLLRPLLQPGELSVGVQVNIEHLAPTPLFSEVRACATYQGKNGKLHLFEVELLDAGGVAGKGTHARAIVQNQRLMEGAQRRLAGPK
ncbi:putative thioesterase [Azomonas agilis]|uniref:Putative thioesterase n=1 Tax=Azomonas agilis TaxID=116849 RepID=A0A562IKA3_9GAMM|nr:thioesterase [Azomonas agilis]TWH71439.1 putative thioesterase [Azomonas agilis]